MLVGSAAHVSNERGRRSPKPDPWPFTPGGTIETSFVKAGIPAVTFEIGSPKVWQKPYIQRYIALPLGQT